MACFGQVFGYIARFSNIKRKVYHMHIFCSFYTVIKNHGLLKTTKKIVCAELSGENLDPQLYNIATKCMLHGRCGLLYSNASCMEIKNVIPKCRFDYSKLFTPELYAPIMVTRSTAGEKVQFTTGLARMFGMTIVMLPPTMHICYGSLTLILM